MKLNRCPFCKVQLSLDAITQDETAREVFGVLLGLDALSGAHLVGYISLFRSAQRELSYDKTLTLMRDTLALCGDELTRNQALVQIVDTMREKQLNGQFTPLKNHNYLKRVLESLPSVEGRVVEPAQNNLTTVQPKRALTSKTAQGLAALEAMKDV